MRKLYVFSEHFGPESGHSSSPRRAAFSLGRAPRPLRDEAWERWHGPSRVGRPCLSVSLFAVTFGSRDLRPETANVFSVLSSVSPEPDSKISNADLSFKVFSRGRPLLANWNCPELELSRVEGGRGRGRPSVVPEMCPRPRARGCRGPGIGFGSRHPPSGHRDPVVQVRHSRI